MVLVLCLSVSTTSLTKEQWGYDPAWLEYVKQAWSGTGRVELVKDDSSCRLEFLEAAEKAFTRNKIPYSYVKTYLSIQVPAEGEGYDEGFPHIHYPLHGTTLIHYLQPGDIPSPLHIFDGDEVVEEIFPEPGLTVFVPHNIYHGVPKNKGTTDRIQLIASAV